MKLNFKVYGGGEPMLILHGLFGSLDNWQTLAKEFAAHYKVYIIDQRNHGRSPHSDEMSYSLMAADLLELMDDEGLQKAYLIGHSMGGKTAMQFAAENPGRIKKLIIVDMGPWKSEPGHDLIFEAMKSLKVGELETRQEADKQMGKKIGSRAIRQFLLKNLTRSRDGFKWKMNLPAIDANYEYILEEVSFPWPYGEPVLFIRGGLSDYIKDEDLDRIENTFSDVEIVTIQNAGHWVHAEAPGEFFNVVKAFLQK